MAAKGGLKMLTKFYAKSLGVHGIRVNNVGPGYILTDMTQKSYDDSEHGFQLFFADEIEKLSENGENELTGDHIIAGLIYRLMVPITDEDMIDSLNTAESILNDDEWIV